MKPRRYKREGISIHPSTKIRKDECGESGQDRGEKHTQKYIPHTRLPRLYICQPLLIRLEARETGCHFGHDAGQDGAEAFVKRERCLALDDHGAGREEAAGFGLFESKNMNSG